MSLRANFKTGKTFGEVKGGGGDNAPRPDQLTDLFKWPSGKWVTLRFVGPVVAYGTHWVETKRKDGTKTKFSVGCLAFDQETETRDSTKHCPWCAHSEAEDGEKKAVSISTEYYVNAIVRSLQEEEPRKKKAPTKAEEKSGFKEKASETWTPVRAIRLTGSVIRELKKLSDLNRRKNKKTGETKAYALSHEKFGMDVRIQYDAAEKVASKKYTLQLGEKSALTEDELEYLLQPIEGLVFIRPLAQEKAEYKRWLERMGVKAKKTVVEDDGDEDDSEMDEDADEDEDEEKPKKKKRSRDEDDEDDEDDETPAKKKKKRRDEEDEDESEDEDDEDETPKKKKRSRDEDDEDDEDKDEEKPKKKKRRVIEEDDEDEEESDEDSEDDDEEDDD